MSSIQDDKAQLLTSLQRKLALKGLSLELRVLRAARDDLVEEAYDNWDGGQSLFTLYLDVPLELFVEIEDGLSQVEKRLQEEISSLRRGTYHEHITKVTVRSSPEAMPAGVPLAEAARRTEAPRYWEAGQFRLFLSHFSSQRAIAHEMKAAFADLHVSAFVAHEDIDPTTEWQLEIEAGLRSMDALAAVLTPDFATSRWCDQEVGIAIGLGRLVIPIRYGSDPYGFLGKYQGVAGVGKTPIQIANEFVTLLARHDLTRARMSLAIVDGFVASSSYAGAKQNIVLVERLPVVTADMAERLRKAGTTNSQVRDAFGVPERLQLVLSRAGFVGPA